MADNPQSPEPERSGAPLLDEKKQGRPDRPSLRSRNAPPVIVKQPPPLSVRLSQLLWVLSFFAGIAGIVYFFVIREDQLPLIVEAVRGVDTSRADDTYTRAGDIVFWSMFAVMVFVLFWQILLLVSFMGRRSGVRWWQLATLIVQGLFYSLGLEMVAGGENGAVLRQIVYAQVGLVLLGLLMSTFPAAISWTARKHDVRRVGVDEAGSGGQDF